MNIQTIASVLFFTAGTALMFSCGNNEKGDTGEAETNIGKEAPEVLTDGQTTYSQEMIDSLKFTSSVKPENGIYMITKSSTRSVDLIPNIQPWESLTNRLRTFNDTINPENSWIVYHRVEGFPIRTAKKPITLEETDAGFELFVPFDSATATKLKLLRSRWPDSELTVLVNGNALNVFRDKERLNQEGVRLVSWDKGTIEEIKEALSK